MIRHAAPRRGFTLIEILVVLGIIAILVGMISVVAIKVQRKSRSTACVAEIAQISNAIGTYKSKMNAAYIPSGGGGTNGGFRLCSHYVDKDGVTPLNWPEVVYLKQVFPQMDLTDNGLRFGGQFVSNGVATAPAGSVPGIELDPNQTLVLFLTGGPPTSYQGFSTNRRQPFTAPTANENRIGPFLDFPSNKYATGAAAVTTTFNASANAATNGAGAASLMDPWGAPYVYYAYNPGINSYMSTKMTYRGVTVNPYIDGTRPFNPKGFQIISAGDNGRDDTAPYGFGPGGTLNKAGEWVPGEGAYAEEQAGADDLSNFNGGPLISRN